VKEGGKGVRKIGLLGGTFDPPHIGHLIMAEEARVRVELDEVWFMPTYIPPHKNRVVTEPHHRIEMVKRAIATNPSFFLSLIEHERKGLSYTVETVEALQEDDPLDAFYFILGGDMVNDLPNWYRVQDLIKKVTFVAFERNGYPLDPIPNLDIVYADMPTIDISSTMIRKKIKRREPIRYYLPESVKDYIEETGLYG
jgi:nicotinate-nucleotide adenylyltransferase